MVFNNSILLGASGQTTGQAPFDPTLIGNSAWYDGSSDYMNSPSFSAQADPTCFIFATWIQLLDFSIGSFGQYLWSAERPSNYASIRISNTNKLIAYSNPGQFESSMIFRDIGWYHIICSYKGPDDTIRMFVNGNEITVTKSNSNTLASNLEPVHASHTHRIGAYFSGAGTVSPAKSYMAQTVFLDGFSFQDGDVTISDFLDTYTFGTNGSQFIPKTNSDLATLAGTAGANSYVIDYADSSDLGNDISSKNNNFTLVSMGSANQSENTPSNSYPIWNPLEPTNSTLSFSEGNLRATGSGGSDGGAIGTIPLPTSGTSEFQIRANNGDGRVGIIALAGAVGVDEPSNNCAGGVGLGFNAAYHYSENGQVRKVISSGSSNISGFDSWSTNDVITVRYNADANELNFLRNNSAVGSTVSTEAGLVYYPVVCRFNNYDITAFFNSNDFPHTIGTGNLEVNSANQTAPSFQGIDYFDATLYEGNGQGQRVGDFVPYTDTYTVSNSAMWYSEDIRKLKYNYSSEAAATSDTTKQATLSFWIKFVETADTDQQVFLSQSDSSQQNRFIMYVSGTNSEDAGYVMIQVSNVGYFFKFNKHLFNKDAWSHCLVHLDTDNSTAADRMKLWIDAVPVVNLQTGSSAYTNLPQGSDLNIFRDTLDLFVGHLSPGSTYASTYNFNSYLAEYHLIDGSLQSLTNFGEIDTSTNRWVPKDYKTNVGTYGNRGFYLKFDGTPGASTGSNMGKDSSGNGLNLTEEFGSGGSAWATTDKFADTPSKNFVTFDTGLNAMGTLSEGGTKIATTTNNKLAYTTMNIPSTGKWYWEVDITSYASGGGAYFGLHEYNELDTGNSGVTAKAVIFQNYNGNANVYNSSTTDATWCNSVSNNGFVSSGDVLQFALDQDAGTLFIGNNNTWFRAGGARDTFANATTVGTRKFPTGIRRRFFIGRGGSFAETYAINFGQQSSEFSGSSTTFNAAADGFFVYTPPTDYKALNQDNLDDTASKITAWAWIKDRDASSNHMLFDRVRGVNEDLHANTADVEVTNQSTLQRFLQRGVQVGADSAVNNAGDSFVLWQWLLGDSATTGTVIPADNPPSLASTVIAADAGHFSVGTYSGASGVQTVGHGLGAAPDMLIVKGRNVADSWRVFHTDLGNGRILSLNLSNVGASSSIYWNNDGPTSTTFTVATDASVNGAGNNYLFLAFKSIPGVCKVGSYEGNASSDGTYINLEFKPRWIMVKVVDSGTGSDGNWTIYDTARQPFNSTSLSPTLFADEVNPSSGPERQNSHKIDILSNGMKFRDNSFQTNSARTYIYLAMAEIGGGGSLPPVYSR